MLNGAEKPETPVFHQPADRIAMPPAAETVAMAIGIQPERWTALRMECAEPDVFSTGALQRNVLRN